MTRERVLVLGAGGQLGRSLAETLARGHDVTAWARKDLDICDTDRMREVIGRVRPSVLVNAAAWTDVDGCEKNVEKSYTVNAIAAGEAAACAVGVGARVVHVSTDYVFDGFSEAPYREEDEPNPLSIYGKSKLEGERLVREAAPEALVVRSSWLFGLGRSNFVMRIFESVMEKPEIPVVTDHRGSPTYTADLAHAMASLLERRAQGVFHVTNAGECSWHEYAVEILRILDINTCKILPVTSDQFKRLAPRPAYSVLDNGKFKGICGEALRPWKQALAEFLGGLNKDM